MVKFSFFEFNFRNGLGFLLGIVLLSSIFILFSDQTFKEFYSWFCVMGAIGLFMTWMNFGLWRKM